MKAGTMDLDTPDARPLHGGFFDLFLPISPETFLSNYWGIAPLAARGNGRQLAHLVDMELLDSVVGDQLLRKGEVRLWREAEEYPETDLLVDGASDKHSILDAIQAGYSLELGRVDQYQPRLADMLRKWESQLHLEFRTSAHMGHSGAGASCSTHTFHDAVVVQTHGTRTWLADTGEIELAAGDVLYVPGRQALTIKASTTPTRHLLIELMGPVRKEVLQAALRTLLLSRPEFRQGYIPGHSRVEDVHERLTALLTGTALDSCVRAIPESRASEPRADGP